MLKLFAFAQSWTMDVAESLNKREEGQTMAEYGVVLAVITLIVVGAITILSNRISGAITAVSGLLPGG
jgi:Flp pilus assembly pilin Flp